LQVGSRPRRIADCRSRQMTTALAASILVKLKPDDQVSPVAEVGPRYWAFLSYSHDDMRWASWLHRALETYDLPRRLVGRRTSGGTVPSRLRPVFRDRDEMRAGSQLTENLKEALAQSASLIVICSPQAARSEWVAKEILYFKSLHAEATVLAAIVGGEPHASEEGLGQDECFPEAMRFNFGQDGRVIPDSRIDQVAADFRPGKDGRSRALLKIVAGILQIDLDELIQRDAQRHHRRLTALLAASVAGMLSMTALAAIAVQERNEATAQRAQAEGLVEFMIGDLRTNLSGRLDALDAIGRRAFSYYGSQQDHGLDAVSLGRRARVLHLLGDIRQQRGDLPGAAALFEQAAQSTGELLRRQPDDQEVLFDHAQSVAYLGEIYDDRGQIDRALVEFRQYQQLARRLVSLNPAKEKWRAEVDEADTDLGVILLTEGRANEAAQQFQAALAVSARLAAAAPSERDRQWDVSQVLAWLADADVAVGNLTAASLNRTREHAVYQQMLASKPSDTDAAVALASNRAALARLRLLQGDAQGAARDLEQASNDMDRLIAGSPDNSTYKANDVPVLILLAQARLQAGQFEEARQAALRAIQICESETIAAQRRGDEGLHWKGVLLGTTRFVAIKATAAAASSLQAQRATLGSARAEAERLQALLALHPKELALARAASAMAVLAGDADYLDHNLVEAENHWRWADLIWRRSPQNGSAVDPGPLLSQALTYRLTYSRPAATHSASRSINALHEAAKLDYQW
jgi:tetratricopeptide (TPR) repeat protein